MTTGARESSAAAAVADLVVRAAEMADAHALAAVRTALSPGEATIGTDDGFSDLIARNAGLVHVVCAAGTVVGYVVLQRASHPAVTARHPLQVWQIYVRPDFHGTGAAVRLMTAALGHARTHSHDLVWLGVSEANERARAFYRSQGFAERGIHRVGHGEHAHEDVVMARSTA
jgi:ribosomal protein S18 acetylase RimI-like enzyme